LFFICEEHIPELLLIKMADFHLSEDELADIRESFEQVDLLLCVTEKSNWFCNVHFVKLVTIYVLR